MGNLRELQALLKRIEFTYAAEHLSIIHQLQDKIWDEPEVKDEELQSLLNDLASDLNFYERVEIDSDENLGYYGDEKLFKLIAAIQTKIEVHLNNS